MSKYFLIFSIVLGLFFACKQAAIEPSAYEVRVKNDYFEAIDSVKIGTHALFGKIDKQQTSNAIKIPKGSYEFSCLTASRLKITAPLQIQGIKAQVLLKLTRQGKLSLE